MSEEDFQMTSENGFYDVDYKKIFYDGGSAGWATDLIHKALEKYPRNFHFDNILEIGGGSGLHVAYVNSNYKHYFLTDLLNVPLEDFAQELLSKGMLSKRIENAEELGIDSDSVDRVIFMCVLHHLGDVEKALEESRRVCKNGGLVSIYLPCDPGIIYRLFRRVILQRRTRKLGINYDLVNAREHRNHFHQINTLIQHVFEIDELKVKRWPIPIFYYDFNIYFIYQIRIVKTPSVG